MKQIWAALFGSPTPGQDDDDMKHHVEAQIREMAQRSDQNRARLTEIQVKVQARRSDADAR